MFEKTPFPSPQVLHIATIFLKGIVELASNPPTHPLRRGGWLRQADLFNSKVKEVSELQIAPSDQISEGFLLNI